MHGMRHHGEGCRERWAARRFGRFGEGPRWGGRGEGGGRATGSASAVCWRKATSSCSRSL